MGSGNMNPDNIVPAKRLVLVMLAGNATLTVQSKESKQHRVFKFIKDSKLLDKNIHKYWILYQSSRIAYLQDMILHLYPEQSKVTKEQEIIQWIWKYILDPDYIDSKILIYHHGKCCKCGRELTDPESISLALGPHCRKLY